MKKLLLTIAFSLFLILPAQADLGVNIGISANTAVWHGEGTENENGEKETRDATGAAGYESFFIEKTLGSRFALGYDFAPDPFGSDTENSTIFDLDGKADGAGGFVENKVQVNFEDLTTFYATFNINENVYIKAGLVDVDVISNESLATGSTYKNTSLDGETYGIGYNADFGNTMFIRFEGTYLDLGSASVTASNTDNKVDIKVEGASAKLAIGKTF
jgi:opacity protein-like surface antigen